MNMQSYLDEIKLDVTGGVLELELDDATLQRIVQSAMRELQRYICSTKLITVPYQKAIDLKDKKVEYPEETNIATFPFIDWLRFILYNIKEI